MATITRSTRRHRPWRLSVADYLRMIEVGILTEQDRVFLWKGQLFEKMTKGRPHVVAVQRLHEALNLIVATHFLYVEKEDPVALTNRNDTMPEPDLKVVRGRREDYHVTPTTRDVPLIVEVADSSLYFDMGEKQNLYAVESVETYWVVSVNGRWIEEFRRPSGSQKPAGYQSRQTYRAGDRVPVRLGDTIVGHVSVDEIYP